MARKRTFRGTKKERFPTFSQRINLSQQRLYKPPTGLYPYKKNEKSHTFTTKTKVKSARHTSGVLHFIFSPLKAKLHYSKAWNLASSVSLLVAPTNLSTNCPPLKNRIVGTLRTPNSAATSLFSSTSHFPTTILPS